MVGNLESQTVEGISGEIIPIPITKNISNDKFIIKPYNNLMGPQQIDPRGKSVLWVRFE